MGTSSVIANSRPSILYVFMHSLNRPRFTVCPGQTWNVPATFNEKLMSFHRPDWHFCPSANPVCGVPLVLLMVFTHLWELLKAFTAEAIQRVNRSKSTHWEEILPLKKSTLVTLITASIRFHLWPVSADIRLLIPLMETHNGINLAVFHLMFLTARHFLLYQME